MSVNLGDTEPPIMKAIKRTMNIERKAKEIEKYSNKLSTITLKKSMMSHASTGNLRQEPILLQISQADEPPSQLKLVKSNKFLPFMSERDNQGRLIDSDVRVPLKWPLLPNIH